MKEIILPQNINITRHAAQRFLERIIKKEVYLQDDIEVSTEIIRNLLNRRVLKFYKNNEQSLLIKYCNAVFIYDIDTESVITIYEDEKVKSTVQWLYKFPAMLKFKGGINSKCKVKLLTEGFTPIRKEGRTIIGQAGDYLYQYDPKFNVICLFGKVE